MNNSISNILNSLSTGESTYEDALDAMKNMKAKKRALPLAKRSKYIKVLVRSQGKFPIWIPGVPIGLLSYFIKLGVKFQAKKEDNYGMNIDLSNLSPQEINLIIETLRSHGPFTLVDIESEEATVKIKLV